MSDIQKLHDSLPLPDCEPFPGETLIADGWVYRDMSAQLSPEMWELFLEIMGDGNYRILASSRSPAGMIRGQFLISPEGIRRMREHAAKSSTAQPVSDPHTVPGSDQ